MSATFPFVGPHAFVWYWQISFVSPLSCVKADPFIRLENALWNVFFYRENQSVAVLTNLWEIWSLQPKLHRRILASPTARLQDFIEATRQLTLAFKACPADIADEIAKMLKEIEHIQYSKNLQAYKEATKARVFTTQFLESRHLVGGKLGVSNLQEDHTVSHRNGLSLSSSTPQLLDTSNKWQGVLASVLHRLHAFARCRDIDIQYEMLRLDPKWTSGVSIETLNELTKQITGTSLSMAERNVMLGNYGTTTFHYFSPNAESCHAFDEIHDQVFDQQVAREVLVCIEDMVDEVITKHRLQQKKYEEEIQRQEVPVRTEQRQKIINERCTGHRT
ncbi:hypothetical protein GN244_ATG10301 [Phytophthora infestans]|uniref:Uncharacterized protein n=1 Tax=Phytophthora infestans TaxID=4787 RepID=A0A833WCV0_PHYIN|nr:hypothetical protein GN244_ATG10301 [Phytophthora infestans]